MKNLYYGLLSWFVAFLLIALFVHNLTYWVAVKWWSMNITTLGSLLVFLFLNDQYKTSGIYQKLFVPKKWYVSILSMLGFILLLTLAYISIEKIAVLTNKRIQAYYLNGTIQGTRARVVGIVKLRFTFKSDYHQPFMAIEYVTADGIIRQGLDSKQYAHLQNGQIIDIIYSRDHPSIFKVE